MARADDPRMRVRAALLFALVFSVLLSGAAAYGQDTALAQLRAKVDHIVVIYQENWSFDALYGRFPAANGIANASPTSLAQVDKRGVRLQAAPLPRNGRIVDPRFTSMAPTAPLAPYDLSRFIQPDQRTGDIIHRFYTQQLQIDGGRMDKFISWSDNGGLVMSYVDATDLPEGRLARAYTLFDNFFQDAFGGSFLNHMWLIAAATPVFSNAPAALVSTPPDPTGQTVADKVVTPDGYVVNTAYSVNSPTPSSVTDRSTLVPNQTMPTIGDRLSEKGVSWAWYSGGWNDAMAGRPDPLFQFHHQPFVYFRNYADGTDAKRAHLKDETDFVAALEGGILPAVSFVKPLGADNEHPGYAALLRGQQHVADLVSRILASPYGTDTAIIVTYDENGGRWDHVAPPVVDRWGPGTRVPAILISAFARRGFVDHTQYDTTAILKLIELRFDLAPLSARDAASGGLLDAFDFSQTSR